LDAQTHPHSAELYVFTGDESSLIALARQQHQPAFRQLYDKHVRTVYALCLRLTGSPNQAEDVTQEVFIQVWRKLHTFNGDSAFSTWLHSLATNTTLSYLRKQKSWWQRMQDSDDYQTLSEQLVDEAPPDLGDLQSALARLPERARIIFVLHALEGYRQESIAKVMGITTGTVKAQFHRARQLLEGWLGESDANSPDSTSGGHE
jgi:RNA polymerase sigma-70 factor (ECF subfamily)